MYCSLPVPTPGFAGVNGLPAGRSVHLAGHISLAAIAADSKLAWFYQTVRTVYVCQLKNQDESGSVALWP